MPWSLPSSHLSSGSTYPAVSHGHTLIRLAVSAAFVLYYKGHERVVERFYIPVLWSFGISLTPCSRTETSFPLHTSLGVSLRFLP